MSSGAIAQQMSDRDYCQELAHLYRSYARNDTTPSAAGPAAMSQCDMGKYADGIAQLSQLLTDRKVPLPPR
jgi:hypothetical protein